MKIRWGKVKTRFGPVWFISTRCWTIKLCRWDKEAEA